LEARQVIRAQSSLPVRAARPAQLANGATIGYWVYDKAKTYWLGTAVT
jgi:hypothetical protein